MSSGSPPSVLPLYASDPAGKPPYFLVGERGEVRGTLGNVDPVQGTLDVILENGTIHRVNGVPQAKIAECQAVKVAHPPGFQIRVVLGNDGQIAVGLTPALRMGMSQPGGQGPKRPLAQPLPPTRSFGR